MPAFIVTAPDGKRYRINAPEGATQEQALAYAQQQFGQAAPRVTNDSLRQKFPAEYDPSSPEYQAKYGPANVPGTENRVAGMGKFFDDRIFGARQRAAEVADVFTGGTRGAELQAQAAERNRRDAPLLDSGAGQVGYVAGGIASTLPLASVPGANTTGGAALLGGLFGLTEPSQGLLETAGNVVSGGVGGAIGQKVGEKALGWLGRKISERTQRVATEKAQNAVRDATLAEARRAGFVVPPSTTNPTVGNRIAESVSGKAATQQAASVKNQRITDALVRRELKLPEGTPLTADTLQAVRSEAGRVYEAVASSGIVKTDGKFVSQIAGLSKEADTIRKSFPGAKAGGADEIAALQEVVLRDSFDARAAVEIVKQLRNEASGNMAWNVTEPARKALGKAQRRAADAIEDQLDRHLRATGNGDLLKSYRDARVQIAKSYTVENALSEGTGNVNAARLASELKKHRPLTGDLKTIAKFAQVAPKATAVPNASAGVSAVDTLVGAVGGATVDPTLFGIPLARVGARELILSNPYQNALAAPAYRPNVNLLRALSAGTPLAQPAGILIGTNIGQ